MQSIHLPGKSDQPSHPVPAEQLIELFVMLESESLQYRLTAIQVLGEIGDLEALQKLRERLAPLKQ